MLSYKNGVRKDDYKWISNYYDGLSSVYSIGAVRRCREFVLNEIQPGNSICFLGVGQGKEAAKAIERGANVTVVDLSQSMLEVFQSHLNKRNASLPSKVSIHQEDVLEFCHSCDNKFDMVVVHFFLNVFAENEMKKVLESGLKICEKGGRFVIADFWQDTEASKVIQWMQKAYWSVALSIFRRLAKNPKHPIYVYDGLLEKQGFIIEKEKAFKVLGIPMFRSIVAKKNRI